MAGHRLTSPSPCYVDAPPPDRPASEAGVESGPTLPRQARAYCGPAHHWSWDVPPDGDPPQVTELPTPAGLTRYHLVLYRETGQPACDFYGNLLYLPVPESREAATPAAPAPRAGRWPRRSSSAGRGRR